MIRPILSSALDAWSLSVFRFSSLLFLFNFCLGDISRTITAIATNEVSLGKIWSAADGHFIFWMPWSLRVSASDTRHQMAKPSPKCWSHKPDWSSPGNSSDRQASQLHIWSHCQDAELYSSPPSSALPHRIVSRSTVQQITEASSRTFIQAMAGPTTRRRSTRRLWRDALRRGHSGATRRSKTTPNSPKCGSNWKRTCVMLPSGECF